MNSKVSIIVPIYNVEQYLLKCVNSLINQTYKNIEIYLVDDGSPDNSGKMCDELSKNDNRIKVVHKTNGGYGSVLEYAINHIKGQYFLICDPDDWLEPNAIEFLMKTMVDMEVDLVVGRKKLVYSDGSIESDLSDFGVLKENIVYSDLIPFLNIPCSPHSKLYKTEYWKKIKFPEKVNNTDFLLYQVYLTRISSAVYLNRELSNYYIDRPGNSFNEDVKLTEKSLKSNAIVTNDTYLQLNKKSKLYLFSVLNLFVRSCKYISLMKKFQISDKTYEKIFINIIKKSKKYRNELFKYINVTTSSKVKTFIKYIVYSMFFKEDQRDNAIKLLNKLSK